MKHLIGKIIVLTRQIYIDERPEGCFSSLKFFAKWNRENPLFGIGIEWYFYPEINTVCDDILAIAKARDQRFCGVDKASFYNIVEKVLTDNVFNEDLFDIEKLLCRKVHTLFDAKNGSGDIPEFAKKLWGLIATKVLASVMDWLLVYPLKNLTMERSWSLCVDGITLLNTEDVNTWSTFGEKYIDIQYLDIEKGTYNDRPISIPLVGRDIFSLIIVETRGTEIGARSNATDKIRTFLSILFSMLNNRQQQFIHSSDIGMEYAYQFPEDSERANYGHACTPVGVLFPPVIKAIRISEQTINKVSEWYRLRNEACPELLQKSVVASHFINYGLNAKDDLVRFIHLFIALDALFGRRGEVEKGITFGIKETFSGEPEWENRAGKLFDLRSELLHGGSSTINSWNGLEAYEKRFRTNPLDDVLEASLSAFARYFTLSRYKK